MHHHTILIALSGLDIGGTETHAVLLCKNLKDMGYKIIVASSGGIYQKELESYGIKHYAVKLNSKKLLDVIKSIHKLNKIIRTENIDIVHAHARIPGFICNISSKLTGVHFITTAHAKFRVNFILKYMSKWGEHTIAVSEDIKEHLIKNLGVKSENITVITNGIDIEQFASGLDYKDLLTELHIDENLKRIVWVSRIDDYLGDTVNCLIDSMDILIEKFNAILIIVGSGNKIEEIKQKAKLKNDRYGREIVQVIGRRTDINKLINMSDVFVGISRAVLEAMSCEKPVVIAGPWSFVGTVNEDNIYSMMQDNFTGRNSKTIVTKELLAESITEVLNTPTEAKKELGSKLRNIVINYYSSTNMVFKTSEIYKKILNKGE